MTDRPTCHFCQFWEPADKTPHEGTCHRYPPKTVMRNDGGMDILGSVWSFTPADAWCGEFRGKH